MSEKERERERKREREREREEQGERERKEARVHADGQDAEQRTSMRRLSESSRTKLSRKHTQM